MREDFRLQLLSDLGRGISQETDDLRDSTFPFQHVSMTIERFNVVAILGTFTIQTANDI